jgi:HlyD family secretion protein
LEKSVLKVPNAALRFKWQPAGAVPDQGSAGAAGAGRPQAVRATNGAKKQGVWVLDGQKPRRAPLALGINDGNETAVLSDELKEGDAVIIEATGQAKKSASSPAGGPGLFR